MNSDDIDGIKRILSPTMRRSQLSNGRGAIEIVSDYKSIQECQISILSDETHDSVERLQEYGFTSNPPSGSDAAIIFIGSNRDHGVIIATDSREYRKKNLKAGEVCIYDKNGSEIYLKSDGSIEISSDSEIKFSAPNIIFTNGINSFNILTHTHGTGVGPSASPTNGS